MTFIYKDNDDILEIEFSNCQKFFPPAYGLTCHCSQGMTIDQEYTIHKFKRMDKTTAFCSP